MTASSAGWSGFGCFGVGPEFIDLPVVAAEQLCAGRQEARHLPVREHDVGRLLGGGEILLPESAARLRRLEQRPPLREQRGDWP